MSVTACPLTVTDHSRDSTGMMYVYPVISRRAGGVSVGINLNPNNACNWHCIYCQVPDLIRGGPPPIDLIRLEQELTTMLDEIVQGDFMHTRVPAGQRRLIDVAFSGNGEPTSAAEFPAAVDVVIKVLQRYALLPAVKLRLITNGSLVLRRHVQRGLEQIAAVGGETWFKVDAASVPGIRHINGVHMTVATMHRRLADCAKRCPTWVQTCLFEQDGNVPAEREIELLVDFLADFAGLVEGIHLYGLARQSAQTESSRLRALPASYLEAVAAKMRKKGLTVVVSP